MPQYMYCSLPFLHKQTIEIHYELSSKMSLLYLKNNNKNNPKFGIFTKLACEVT